MKENKKAKILLKIKFNNKPIWYRGYNAFPEVLKNKEQYGMSDIIRVCQDSLPVMFGSDIIKPSRKFILTLWDNKPKRYKYCAKIKFIKLIDKRVYRWAVQGKNGAYKTCADGSMFYCNRLIDFFSTLTFNSSGYSTAWITYQEPH